MEIKISNRRNGKLYGQVLVLIGRAMLNLDNKEEVAWMNLSGNTNDSIITADLADQIIKDLGVDVSYVVRPDGHIFFYSTHNPFYENEKGELFRKIC